MDALSVPRPPQRVVVVAAVGLVLAAGGLLAGVRASAGPPTWAPSAAERQKALAVARAEASTSIPGMNGTPKAAIDGTWPANVHKVMLVGSSRKDAAQFVDGSPAGDDRRVVIIRMFGDFAVANTGPTGSNPVSTGHQMTVVVDANTGDVLDFGLEPAVGDGLPNASTQYNR